MAKHTAPATRGFTIAEKRALLFEKVSLYALLLVTVIAAAISFIALRAVGGDAGLGSASFLLPIAIDGFGVACSVGIIRSVAQGEGFRERASEWLGLVIALGLSILGNVHHAISVGAATLPDYVKVSYAFAIPVIVAYGIHVYGRAMSKGISAHVLADNPDELTFDLRHLGDTLAAQHAPVRVTKQPTTRAPVAQPATRTPAQAPTPVRAQPAVKSIPAAAGDPLQARARAVFDRLVAANPGQRPDAALVWRESGLDQFNPETGKRLKDASTVRRWCNDQWWPQIERELGMGGVDPIVAQVAADEGTSDRGEARARPA